MAIILFIILVTIIFSGGHDLAAGHHDVGGHRNVGSLRLRKFVAIICLYLTLVVKNNAVDLSLFASCS